MQRSRIVFVVGTGRSGTHFLTQCLTQHPQVSDLTDGRENAWVFAASVRLATSQAQFGDRASLVAKYRWLRRRCPTAIFVDQSHSNLWNHEFLAPAFKDALWLATVRDPRSVVASMLQHPGVRSRTKNWRSYPFPSPFLGVTEHNLEQYEASSLAGRCAYRWLSHIDRTRELAEQGKVRPLSFEQLVQSSDRTIGAVWEGLGLDVPADVEYHARPETIDGWRDVLDDDQAQEIQRVADETTSYRELRQLLGEVVEW